MRFAVHLGKARFLMPSRGVASLLDGVVPVAAGLSSFLGVVALVAGGDDDGALGFVVGGGDDGHLVDGDAFLAAGDALD